MRGLLLIPGQLTDANKGVRRREAGTHIQLLLSGSVTPWLTAVWTCSPDTPFPACIPGLIATHCGTKAPTCDFSSVLVPVGT